jgi:hypothetical protein
VRDDLEFDRGQNLKCLNVRFGSKADIVGYERDVRFTPESGHCRATVGRLLSASSGQCAAIVFSDH